jgi:hypothetical protein
MVNKNYGITFDKKDKLELILGEDKIVNCYLYQLSDKEPVDLTSYDNIELIIANEDDTELSKVGVPNAIPELGKFTVPFLEAETLLLKVVTNGKIKLKLEEVGVKIDLEVFDKALVVASASVF